MELSVIEQSPRLRSLYTQLCFCYSMPDTTTQSEVIKTLTNGLEKLTVNFPWVAGQVVAEDAGENDSGTFRIRPYQKLPILSIKDFTTDSTVPTMDAFRKARFPFAMLDERVICPRATLPTGNDEPGAEQFPVLLLQANFIAGGLLLSILACHGTMDIVGQVQIIHLLSKACRNQAFTSEEITNGKLDRRNLIPIYPDSWKPDPKPAHKADEPGHLLPNSGNDTISSSTKHFMWAYFGFQSAQLTALKALVLSSLPNSSKFVSTDDALCALIWQSVARARLARLVPTTESVFTRAVDMRRYMDIPETYTGNVATKTKNTSTLETLANESLGVIASQLRSDLDPDILKYQFRAQATITSRTKDKSATDSKGDRSNYVNMSSWSKVNCYQFDFGLGLGVPEAVRRPRFEPIEGVVYLLPKNPDGEILAGLCLRLEDMERVKTDEEFMRYAQHIG